MRWEEGRAARRPSLAGGEGDREGVSGGVTGAEAVHHEVVEVILAGGEGQAIDQTEGGEGRQPGGHPGFVGLSGRKLSPNELVLSFCSAVDRILVYSARLHTGH